MVFSSQIFIFTFLPAFLLAYYMLPFRFRSGLIVLASWIFYGWWRADFLLLLIGLTIWTYLCGKYTYNFSAAGRPLAARRLATIGIAGCLAVLGYFKYLGFFVDSFAEMIGTTPAELGFTLRIILPIGISFFVFHAISYLVDMLRREVSPADNFIDFAAFISLFPHLVAGPVLRYKDLSGQLKSRVHTPELFIEGVRWFVFGLAKKVLIADSVAPVADMMFNLNEPSFVEAWTGAIAYSVQLYFDFSGYSEMAVGLGLMIGIRFIQNFNFPYLSTSITDFWRRWHISLSVWLRDYVYIPLGGNRRGTVRTYINLFLTMLIGGIWHGANWTFIIWGAMHGIALGIERLLGVGSSKPRYPVLAIALTMFVVVCGWVLFRAPTIDVALGMYAGMAGLNGFSMDLQNALLVSREQLTFLIVAIAIIYLEPRVSKLTIPDLATLGAKPVRLAGAVTVAGLGVVSVMRIAEQSYSPFLYFQF